jgi:hypothetical protein
MLMFRVVCGGVRDDILYLVFGLTEGSNTDRYLQAVQTNCPWMLRYLAAMVILHKVRPYQIYNRNQVASVVSSSQSQRRRTWL